MFEVNECTVMAYFLNKQVPGGDWVPCVVPLSFPV